MTVMDVVWRKKVRGIGQDEVDEVVAWPRVVWLAGEGVDVLLSHEALDASGRNKWAGV
jgi:hypothetical protein